MLTALEIGLVPVQNCCILAVGHASRHSKQQAWVGDADIQVTTKPVYRNFLYIYGKNKVTFRKYLTSFHCLN